jgi:hypothetical protein
LAYVLRYERVFPAPAHSQLREVLRIIVVSVGSLTFVGILLALVRSGIPERTPNIRGLVQDPYWFFKGHHVHLTVWAVCFIAAATGVAAIAAETRIFVIRRQLRKGSSSRLFGKITEVSAWRRTFVERRPPGTKEILVGLQMTDDSYVSGFLDSFNPDTRENDERALTLRQADRLTDHQEQPLGDMTVVSAKQIVRMDVTYLNEAGVASTPDQEFGGPPAAAPRRRGAGKLAVALLAALVVAGRVAVRWSAARRGR